LRPHVGLHFVTQRNDYVLFHNARNSEVTGFHASHNMRAPCSATTHYTQLQISGCERRINARTMQYSKWAGICRYTVPELISVPEFHTDTYQYILHPFLFSNFLTVYHCFVFKRYTGTSKFPFRAVIPFAKLMTVVRTVRLRTRKDCARLSGRFCGSNSFLSNEYNATIVRKVLQ
jgi:hypothetical protein